MGSVLAAGYSGSAWIDWSWVNDHTTEILTRLREHVVLAGLALLYGLIIAVPLAVLASRKRRLLAPILSVTGVLYTIPSLAAFAFLLPFTGLSRETALIPLTAYSLLILVRNVVTGLDAVPPEVVEAARGMGYSGTRQLLRIELPLAVPTIIAGVRIAAVTLIGLVPVAALIGQGGLGAMMLDGFQRSFRTPITVAGVLVIALAVVVDAALLALQRLATPWTWRARSIA
ncbi:MAG TPA: ABC transporter permease [Acidimicrobiia bacterium]|jgi:osmoprotectant transport system permease protein